MNDKSTQHWPGRWFLADTPSIEIAGTLHMEGSLKLSLELIGSFSDDLTRVLKFGGSAVVHGISTSGSLLTVELVDEELVGKSAFGTRKTYRVHRVIEGDLLPNLDPEILSVEFGLSRLHDWVGPKTFGLESSYEDYPYGATLTLKYQDPKPITLLESDDLSIYLQFWSGLPFVGPQSRSGCLRHFSGLRIDSHKPRKLSALLPVVGQMRAMLSFATATPNWVTYLSAHRQRDDSKPLQTRVTPRGRLKFFPVDDPEGEPAKMVFPSQMLFALADDMSMGRSATSSWVRSWPKMGPLIQLFLGANQSTEIYQEHRFISLIHAVEGFHRLNYSNSLVPKAKHKSRMLGILSCLAEEDREFVGRGLQYSNEPSLRLRLKELLDIALKTVPGFMGSEQEFLRSVVETRHYHSHFEPKLKRKAAGSAVLFELCSVLSSMFEILTLLHLGFPAEKVKEVINRGRFNRPIRGVVRFVLENRWGVV
ncbi:MAG TPA: HEPN domain-containing protein [Thermoanaerobaculia bacterium]|nr:HEPN domain-containing protein [Thermoanaerobaculia bacterium]